MASLACTHARSHPDFEFIIFERIFNEWLTSSRLVLLKSRDEEFSHSFHVLLFVNIRISGCLSRQFQHEHAS